MDSATSTQLDGAINSIGIVWILLVLSVCIFTIFILSWMLLKREKTLQLAKFSAGPTGIALTYEIDRDKKILLLVEENILLRKSLAAVKNEYSSFRWAMVLALTLIWMLTSIESATSVFRRKKKVKAAQSISSKSLAQENEDLMDSLFKSLKPTKPNDETKPPL